MNSNKFVKCPGCGALVMDINGPVHRYIGAVSGCWNIYCKVLARDFGSEGFPDINRLTVDTYSVQHPGKESQLTTQSVAVHLLGLYFNLEKNYSNEVSLELIRRILKGNNNFYWLTPPENPGRHTISDIYNTKNLNEYVSLVKVWANEVWESWRMHHDTVRHWAEQADE